MKTLYLQQPKNQQSIHLILMILFLFQGIINLGNDKKYMLVLASLQILLALIYGFYYWFILRRNKSKLSPKIILEETELTLFKGLFYKPRTIQHEDIKVVQIKPEQVSVMTKEKYELTYSFDYEALNKAQIQDEIEAYCEEKNISIEKINYRNY